LDVERIYPKVSELLGGLDPDRREAVPAEASFEELGIDSLTTMDLLALVENEFGIEIPDSQLPEINSIKDLVDYVAEASS
jgi:acyl carrier protein